MKTFFKYLGRLIINPFGVVSEMPIVYLNTIKRNVFGKYSLICVLWLTAPFDFVWRITIGLLCVFLLCITETIKYIFQFISYIIDSMIDVYTVPNANYLGMYKTISKMIFKNKDAN